MAPSRDRPIVVYDGSCGFCRDWVARLRIWDRHEALEYLPLQDPRAETLTGRSRAGLEQAAHVVLPSGDVLAGAAALRAICPYLPWGRLPALVFSMPGVLPLTERIYRWIAWHRGPVGSRQRDR